MNNFPPLHEVTPDELYSNPQWRPCELVHGKVIQKDYAGHHHGEIGARLLCLLYPLACNAGRIYCGGTGFISPDGKSVLAPDAMFLSLERIPQLLSRRGFLPIPPDFAAEILAPNEAFESVSAKVDLYLTMEIRLVWVICSNTQSVHIFERASAKRICKAESSLCGSPVMPQVEFSVAELFMD